MSDANIPLPDDSVAVSITTVVGGVQRGQTVHIENCPDGFPEVEYKKTAFLMGIMEAGQKMQEQAVQDIINNDPPPWKK